jgi:hypothetical protein
VAAEGGDGSDFGGVPAARVSVGAHLRQGALIVAKLIVPRPPSASPSKTVK